MMEATQQQRLQTYRETIERELEIALNYSGSCSGDSDSANPDSDSTLAEAVRYSVLGGGKRIRGALVLEFCRVFKGDTQRAVPVGAAIEMIHAFSLVHDDLPCMDDDDFRRGKPSCHKKFGEATALLAGDALLSTAFNTVAAAAFLPKSEGGLKADNAVSVMSVLSNAASEMIKGQQRDMDLEKAVNSKSAKITEQELLAMYARKTCALISAACVCGAVCANAPDKNLHIARGYGFALGLAFQITDDLLDLKTEKAGKKTVPLLIGEKKARELANSYTDTAVKTAEKLNGGDFLKELAISLSNRGA